MLQSGDIDPGPDIRTFFTAITTDGYGNAAMCFARSSPNEYISIARCVRSSIDPLGTMREVVIVKNSTAPYNSGRWGDYSGVSIDPSDNRTFWMHGEYTPGASSWNTWISCCKAPNIPPDSPNIIGPTTGVVGIEYEYTIETTDPEDEDIYYYVEWDDGTNTDWIGPYPSGEILTVNHTWTSPDNYNIRAKAKDINDDESEWSNNYPMAIIENEPPNPPEIDGPNHGKVGTYYNYTFTSNDPDGDNVSYFIKWCDGDITEWTAFQISGFPGYTESHKWDEIGTYTIEAKAKDIYGFESDWATLEIIIPRNKLSTNIFSQRFHKIFSNVILMVRYVLKL